MPSDLSEKSLENTITNYLCEKNNYELGKSSEFRKDYALDEKRLFRFLEQSQPEKFFLLKFRELPTERENFLKALDEKLRSGGVLELLRGGLRYKNIHLELYYCIPSKNYPRNIFSLTRQLHYSEIHAKNSIDLCIFINGLPVITMELKNKQTGTTSSDAVEQYKHRDEREKIFAFKRCLVHFALDGDDVQMCTDLKGEKSFFLPFNKGNHGGAGNPPNTNGFNTSYLWEEILTRESFSDILENYIYVNDDKNAQIFPRWHQLNLVRELLQDVRRDGVGKRYLIQHSAGSGKSNSIAWLACRLVNLAQFDSVILVTDRKILDKQIRDTMKHAVQMDSLMGWAYSSSELGGLLHMGRKIIITTIQKFQKIFETLTENYREKNFAVLIDEAHSSQSGKLSDKMRGVLGGALCEDGEDFLNALMLSHKMPDNVSFFAFTATPKNKTLELFGKKEPDGKFYPHYLYSMQQAIEEGFILDVVKYFVPVKSYFHIIKTVDNDPLFNKKRAKNLLKSFVEGHTYAIKEKARIIIEHFYTELINGKKIDGQARAMIVTDGIDRALKYYDEISLLLKERGDEYKAIIAFSGEAEYHGELKRESDINNFSSASITKRFQEDPYRILIAADKFQTGFDEPLLHTMYVDKKLSDINAVQTLSRLNRTHEAKHDTFILDFENDAAEIQNAFNKYYKTTILSGETDAEKLSGLLEIVRGAKIFSDYEVEEVVNLFMSGADYENIAGILNTVKEKYNALKNSEQIKFSRVAKSFVKIYSFLAAILPYGNLQWEKYSVFLKLLISELPKVSSDEDVRGLFELVKLEDYRAEVQGTIQLRFDEARREISPENPSDPAKNFSDMDTLSRIIAELNALFENILLSDKNLAAQKIFEVRERIMKSEKYINALENADMQNARDEAEKIITGEFSTGSITEREIYNETQRSPLFKRWLLEILQLTA